MPGKRFWVRPYVPYTYRRFYDYGGSRYLKRDKDTFQKDLDIAYGIRPFNEDERRLAMKDDMFVYNKALRIPMHSTLVKRNDILSAQYDLVMGRTLTWFDLFYYKILEAPLFTFLPDRRRRKLKTKKGKFLAPPKEEFYHLWEQEQDHDRLMRLRKWLVHPSDFVTPQLPYNKLADRPRSQSVPIY